jgi:hypothetical protein
MDFQGTWRHIMDIKKIYQDLFSLKKSGIPDIKIRKILIYAGGMSSEIVQDYLNHIHYSCIHHCCLHILRHLPACTDGSLSLEYQK